MRLIHAALIGCCTLSLIASCKKDEAERDPCLQPKTIVMQARTMRRASDTTTAVIDTLLRFPLARPLTDPPSRVIYNLGQRTQNISLSLSQVADSCRWALQPDSAAGTLTDTLTFYYTRQTRFLSNACGYTTFFNLERIRTTTHAIDSVILQNAAVSTDVNVVNFRIYY